MEAEILELCGSEYEHALLKYVKVFTTDEKEHEGWLVTVDPPSGNLFLVSVENEKLVAAEIIMSDAVSYVEVVRDSDKKTKTFLEGLFEGSISPLQNEKMQQRKASVVEFIKKHRFPVKEPEEDPSVIEVAGALTIHPPYNSDSCVSDNEIILKRVRDLLTNLKIV